MNEKISRILGQMAELEDELRNAVHEQESRMFFEIKGKRVEFERTEQYFCPIKHARKILGTHGRYNRFLAYGDAQDYAKRLEEFRKVSEKAK